MLFHLLMLMIRLWYASVPGVLLLVMMFVVLAGCSRKPGLARAGDAR